MGKKPIPAISAKMFFKDLKGDNKELMIIPGAVHTDLYDRTDIIPFDKIAEFFRKRICNEKIQKSTLLFLS